MGRSPRAGSDAKVSTRYTEPPDAEFDNCTFAVRKRFVGLALGVKPMAGVILALLLVKTNTAW